MKDQSALYFLHIPKTAGLSMRSLFEAEFGATLCPNMLWDHFYLQPQTQAANYAAYFGHFGNDLGRFLGKPLRVATMLREPVARTVSHYMHVKRDQHHPMHRLVSQQTLWDFVSDPLTLPMVYNLQARYLIDTGVAIADLARRFPARLLAQSGLAMAWETASFAIDSGAMHAAAVSAMTQLDFVGVTEEFDSAVARLTNRYEFTTRSYELRNEAPAEAERPTLDAAVIAEIRACTEIDAALYNLARTHGGAADEMRGPSSTLIANRG